MKKTSVIVLSILFLLFTFTAFYLSKGDIFYQATLFSYSSITFYPGNTFYYNSSNDIQFEQKAIGIVKKIGEKIELKKISFPRQRTDTLWFEKEIFWIIECGKRHYLVSETEIDWAYDAIIMKEGIVNFKEYISHSEKDNLQAFYIQKGDEDYDLDSCKLPNQ